MTIAAPSKQNPRADSFTLYMNFVGDAVLRGLLPKKKWIKNTTHKTPILDALETDGATTKYTTVLKGRSKVTKIVNRT